jgi:hypothetical protein
MGKIKISLPAVIALCVLIGVVTAFAKNAGWNNDQKPPVSLKEALTLAEADLKQDDVEFFCIGASLARTFSAGDWELHYSSTQGKELWLSVGSDKKVRKSTSGFSY